MVTARVEVRNLREINGALRSSAAAVPVKLRTYLLPVAKKVASRSASKVPRKSGRAARSLTARASAGGAGVSGGGTGAPHYPWLDFGGTVGKGHRPGVPYSGSVKRAFLRQGRYVYPTIEEMRPEIEDAVLDAVARAATDAGLTVTR